MWIAMWVLVFGVMLLRMVERRNRAISPVELSTSDSGGIFLRHVVCVARR